MADRLRTIGVASLVGALTGALILGALGRLAMRALAVARGMEPGYSIGGTLDVVVVGLIYGAVGGLLLGMLGRVRAGRILPGAVMGVLLFLFAFFTSAAARSAASGMGYGFLRNTFGIAALIFLAWGVLTSVLIRRFLPVSS